MNDGSGGRLRMTLSLGQQVAAPLRAAFGDHRSKTVIVTGPRRWPADKLVGRVEAAELLGAYGYKVAPSTLAFKASRGGSPEFRKVGNRALYQVDDLMRWLEARLAPQPGAPLPSDPLDWPDGAQVSRDQAARFYAAHGYRVAPATLAGWSSRRDGPPFERHGRAVYYRIVDLRRDIAAWLCRELGSRRARRTRVGPPIRQSLRRYLEFD